MNLWCHKICLLAIVLASLGCIPQTTPAQESGKILVPLEIVSPYEQSMTVATIRFEETSIDPPDKRKPGTIRLGHLPGRLRVAVETIAESPNTYRVQIDTDGDNDWADESPVLLSLSSSVKVNVRRRLGNGKSVTLPYSISYERSTDGLQQREYFYWRPNYVATGKLKHDKCEASVKVLDVNGDAIFDRQDFAQATTIYIDDGSKNDVINLNDPRVIRNRDGSIVIPEEMRRALKPKWHKGEAILEVCGGFYLVDNVEPDGSVLTLSKAQMKIPTIGEALPPFSMVTLDGGVINATSLKGTVTLLDFWASWCIPCVEKFGEVKRIAEAYKGDMKVIAINVDESARLSAAYQVIKEYKLTWPQVASGQGERDPMWKVFGSMSNNGLAIPLYVLVDSNGIIRYAGNGGSDLSELRARIKELEPGKPVQPKVNL